MTFGSVPPTIRLRALRFRFGLPRILNVRLEAASLGAAFSFFGQTVRESALA
jgi:hypothetical protein